MQVGGRFFAKVAIAWAMLGTGAEADPQVQRIWNEAKHSAFTDLIEWEGAYWVAFRESDAHVYGEDGKTRVIRSRDGETWESFGVLTKEGIDLRDPKLSISPAGDLVILQGGTDYDGRTLVGRKPYVAFVRKGASGISALSEVQLPEAMRTGNDWLWRLTWDESGNGFGVVYQPGEGDWQQHLVKTRNGIEFEQVTTFGLPGKPNEATVRFAADGEMWVAVRNEAGTGHLGRSRAPYKEWTWKRLPVRLGGPDLLQLKDGSWLLATRKYAKGGAKTMIGGVTPAGEFTERLVLPSGGDTSYPRMLEVGDRLWVSYYSSHEGRSAIYLAKVPLEDLRRP